MSPYQYGTSAKKLDSDIKSPKKEPKKAKKSSGVKSKKNKDKIKENHLLEFNHLVKVYLC